MKIKTSALTGARLDWAVAICEGYSRLRENPHAFNNELIMRDPRGEVVWFHQLKFSSDWELAGPIIEREGIATREIPPVSGDNGHIFTRRWIAEMFRFPGGPRRTVAYSSAPLVAAMRCYVASCLGDEVKIPEELL